MPTLVLSVNQPTGQEGPYVVFVMIMILLRGMDLILRGINLTLRTNFIMKTATAVSIWEKSLNSSQMSQASSSPV